jgi:hypothetical protein
VSAAAVSPLPMLIAAVATLAAWVLAAGKGGGLVVNPANVHCAIVNPQTGAGPAGALFTVSVSVAELPVSSVPMKRWSEVLLYMPVTGTVTLTLIVQLLFGARLPFENERDADPAVGANVGESQPAVEALGVLATTITPGVVGKVSVKLSPLSVTEVGFVRVKMRVETPPTVVGSGLKFFEIVTADGSRI